MKTKSRIILVLIIIEFILGTTVGFSQTAYSYKDDTPKNQFPKFRATIDSVIYSN